MVTQFFGDRQIKDGTIAIADLSATGTPGATTYLRGDNTWTVPPDTGMLNPMTTGGDIIYGGASGSPLALSNGIAGQVLRSSGTTLAPTWATNTPTAGGATTQIQYSDAGTLNGNSLFTLTKATGIVTFGGGTQTFGSAGSPSMFAVRAGGNTYYAAINAQSTSAGTFASTDLSVGNDVATSTSGFINMGISSSTNSDSTFNITATANQSYVYTTAAGPLIFATNSAQEMVFGTGGTVAANRRLTISGSASTVTIGLAGTSLGTLALTGNTSGTCNITVAAAAGTPTITMPTVTGTLALNNGSNWTIASQAIGDLAVATSTTAYGRLAAVATGSVLTSAGTGTAPAWTTALAISGAITSSGAGVGYATGAGGTVTQLTSRTTTVVLSKLCGNITMFSAAQAADAINTFTLTNTFIAATDNLMVQHISATNGGAWTFSTVCAAGSATITIRNVSNASITEASPLRFTLIKGVTA